MTAYRSAASVKCSITAANEVVTRSRRATMEEEHYRDCIKRIKQI
jgi:hypothetical protein